MRDALKWVWCAVLLGATPSLAQDVRPAVAPFTLDVKRVPSGFSKKDREELQKIFPLLLRGAGAAVPDSARLSSALLEIKRQDCDREDECLAQLAKVSGSLYAIYVSVDYTLEKHVVVAGRVVRDDGQVARATASLDLVKEAPFKDAARDGVNQLLARLEVGGLPAVREAVKKQPDPEVKKDPEVPPPPPPPLVDVGKGQRDAGAALLVGGLAAAGISGVITAVGAGVGYGAPKNAVGEAANEAAAAQLATGRTMTTIGFVGLGAGAAVAAVGAIVLVTAPAKPTPAVTSISAVPTPGGGMVMIGGQF